MKALLKDGSTLKGSIFGLCHGYRAEKLEFEAKDIDSIIFYMDEDPDMLKVALYQLRHRLQKF